MSLYKNTSYNATVQFAVEAAKARAWRVLRHRRTQSIEDWLDSPEGRACVDEDAERAGSCRNHDGFNPEAL